MKMLVLIWDYTAHSDTIAACSQKDFFDSLPPTGEANDWMNNSDNYREKLDPVWCYGEVIYNWIFSDSAILKKLAIPYPDLENLPAVYCLDTTSDGYSCRSKFQVTPELLRDFIKNELAQ